MVFNYDDFSNDLGAVKTFPIHIENDDGAWDGVLRGFRYPDEPSGTSHTQGPLTG